MHIACVMFGSACALKESATRDVGNRLPPLQAYGVAKFGRAHKAIQRKLDLGHRKDRAPLVDRSAAAQVAPPVVVVVMGPPGSGKTTLIKVRPRWQQSLETPATM